MSITLIGFFVWCDPVCKKGLSKELQKGVQTLFIKGLEA